MKKRTKPKMNQEHLDEPNQKQKEETEQKGLNKPYDSAFKSIVQKCPRLALFLIDEMFYQNGVISKEYDGTEQVNLLNGELTDLEGGNLAEDIRLKVENEEHGIHMECESSPGDFRVMLRVVQYHMRTAVDNMKVYNRCIKVRIDVSGVLFLRCTKNTPKKVWVIVEGPLGSMFYPIPALLLKSYDRDLILEKKLYILLPFLFFNYEKELENVDNPQNFEKLKSLYGQIIDDLKEKTADGSINAYEAQTLYVALRIVLKALGRKNNAMKEVKEIMGGRVLKFPADKVFNEGKSEGRKEERKEWLEKEREWKNKDKEWQNKDKEWQNKDKEWQKERQRMQQEIERLQKSLKEMNATPGLAT